MKTLLFFTLMLLAATCTKDDDYQKYIWLVNNSNNSFTAVPSFYSPDTAFNTFRGSYDVLPNQRNPLGSKIGWRNRINGIKDKTLIIFLVDLDTLSSYNIDEIMSEYRITKRYDLTVEELESMDWTITYP